MVQCINFYVTQRCTTSVSVVQFSLVIGTCHFVFRKVEIKIRKIQTLGTIQFTVQDMLTKIYESKIYK